MKSPTSFLVLFLTAGFANAAPKPQTAAALPLTETEKWTLNQLVKKGKADLSKFPQPELSAAFLEQLLTGKLGESPYRNRIEILGATIKGSPDLSNSEISFEIEFYNCEFLQGITFGGAHLVRSASFLHSTFKESVGFDGVRTDQYLYFQGSIFEDGIGLAGAQIGGDLDFNECYFQNASSAVWLRDARIARNLLFTGCTFTASADLSGTEVFGDLDASHSMFESDRAASFDEMKVAGKISFDESAFEKGLNLASTRCDNIDWSFCNFKPKATLQLRGTTYRYAKAAEDESESHRLLLRLFERCDYSADIYQALEAMCLRFGYKDDSDRAFIEGKRRERKEKLNGLAWFRSYFLDWLVGYGRHPERAGYVCIGIVVLGYVLFPASKMKLRDPKEDEKPEDIRPQYNRLWYSLGLFLPVVDLKTSDLWKPTNEHVFLQYYLRIHILLGWIFVPIFLAAISGLIK